MKRSFGFILLLYFTVVGYALFIYPPKMLDYYLELVEEHPNLAMIYLVAVGIGAFILTLLSVWIALRLFWNNYRKVKQRKRRGKNPSELTAGQIQQEIAENLASGDELAQGATISEEVRAIIRDRIEQLEAKRTAKRLEIVAFGTISSGKSSLLNALAGRDVFQSNVIGGTTATRAEIPWPGSDQVILIDTPGLGEAEGETRAAQAALVAKDADLVLFVVDGPLKAYERALVAPLATMEKRVLLCLNKEDWFPNESKAALLSQLAEQVQPAIAKEDIVTVRAKPASRTRTRVAADGTEVEESVPVEPDISALANRMQAVVQKEGADLLLANLLLQSRGLLDDAKAQVTAGLDRKAQDVIKKHMWAAGSATAVNPIPLLDIAGGSAITAKMVFDLADVYQQPIDSDTVVTLLGQLGKNLIAMLGTTAIAPAVTAAIGTMLKTIPGIGTITGGLLQGSVQALVTRWIGNVFCEYFKNEMKTPPGGIAEIARGEWAKLTAEKALKKLVLSGRSQLKEAEETNGS